MPIITASTTAFIENPESEFFFESSGVDVCSDAVFKGFFSAFGGVVFLTGFFLLMIFQGLYAFWFEAGLKYFGSEQDFKTASRRLSKAER